MKPSESQLPLVAKSFIALMRENVAATKPFDGINGMLSHLAQGGMGLAVVSSNSHDNVSTVLGAENARLIGSFECGMSFGAVSWGYGTIESLREHSPEEQFDCVADIKRLA